MELSILGIRHVALNVRNVRKSLEFYSQVLGMTLEWMPDSENAYLTSGEDNLALHQLPPGQEPGPVQTVHHIGFVVLIVFHVRCFDLESHFTEVFAVFYAHCSRKVHHFAWKATNFEKFRQFFTKRYSKSGQLFEFFILFSFKFSLLSKKWL